MKSFVPHDTRFIQDNQYFNEFLKESELVEQSQ
jgi:hypothetical protein